ncbi:MAG: hypothetical protein PHU40_10910 [Sulfurimonas sp.]|jgi:DNA polymerase-3 subunit epsilon|nr:hypothetical protein [Sulfurimonas sp.]
MLKQQMLIYRVSAKYQDATKLAGHEKSSKHRKAEELIQKGQHIQIIGESDFKEMVRID